MNNSSHERLEMRWLPVVDAAGRTRMEATWIAVPTVATLPTQVTTHAA